MRLALLTLALAAAVLWPSGATAQSGTYRTRTVLVYGDDPCPKSTNPDEIIVCARRPEEERYRIPKELREAERAIATEDNVAVQRTALANPPEARMGPGSCSTVGPGGASGCTLGIDVVQAARTVKRALEVATEPVDD
ncbi:MAG: hypothetical protein NZM40_07145 [Sphingomonadaceae bacterium]|uniref:hypothetical protein n=1 Tax=Thermaurantiacus sp. TaxID=2820283 RepID=UPI00298F0743|nr:hypothetical protein [Thermaurantiacus sp.]MCS6987190.1 hypothetical protein [Sphingomonadaceae bacterium]MDW8415776.1 hypothetical protein [Thermaurantiacus sp.]